MNAATDAIVWVLPIPSIMMSKLPLSQKITCILLFLIGAGAVSASVGRILAYDDNEVASDPMCRPSVLNIYAVPS